METQILISINLIKPNPYQPRESEDPAVVTEIAASIKQNGLMQVPTARQVNGRYELAFGHTRLAAFKQLGEESMPLIVRQLSDLQMFELGIAENIKRRDLNPIEQGKAMRRYMQEFGKTSAETGEFFNASAEKVRYTVRLLNLPPTLQAGVADGTITQNNASRLLTIQRVAPKEVEAVSKELIKSKNADPDVIISEALKESGNSVEMWPTWRSGEPQAGVHLWPLRLPANQFPSKHLPVLTVNDVAKALDLKPDAVTKQSIQAYLSNLNDKGAEYFMEAFPADSSLIERINHLLHPPACTACPLYAKVGGAHFCTFKACYSRKAKAWQTNEIQAASKKLKIAIYDLAADGKDTFTLVSYRDAHQKLVKSAHADLRLKSGRSYSDFDGVPDGFMIVAIGETAKKLHKAEERPNGDRSTSTSNAEYEAERRRLNLIRETNKQAMNEFLWNVATPAFKTLLAGIPSLDFLNRLADRMAAGVPAEEPGQKASKETRMDFYRQAILFELLTDDFDEMWSFAQKKHPVMALAKYLQGFATTWGVKLPKNWLDLAAEADKGIAVNTLTAT